MKAWNWKVARALDLLAMWVSLACATCALLISCDYLIHGQYKKAVCEAAFCLLFTVQFIYFWRNATPRQAVNGDRPAPTLVERDGFKIWRHVRFVPHQKIRDSKVYFMEGEAMIGVELFNLNPMYPSLYAQEASCVKSLEDLAISSWGKGSWGDKGEPKEFHVTVFRTWSQYVIGVSISGEIAGELLDGSTEHGPDPVFKFR